jgi:uroporphyrinogen III methyltransferase/synthase
LLRLLTPAYLLRTLPHVASALIKGGRAPETPAVSVEWGTTIEQRSVTAPLADIAQTVRDAGLGTPLLTVVGNVAGLREHIAWFESRPLFGKRVLVTRTRQQSSALAGLLRRQGAIPIELPALDIVPVATDEQLEAMTRRLEAKTYAWCLLTSANAVDSVMAYLDRSGRDARVFAGGRLAALGSATADALQRHGLRADLIAGEFSSTGLLDSLRGAGISGRVLLPRAEGANPALVAGLRAAGCDVDEVVLYESRPPAEVDPEALSQIRNSRIDVATFASSSSVRNLAELLGPGFEHLKRATIASIGPVTSQTAREYGLAVEVEPAEHTIPALVEALVQHYASKQ